jgi:hypothetical protein
MTTDPRDKEEAFIAGLAADTGRDLERWMALIDAQTFAHRNDMIDWLRQQGLTFAKASRLERIHHNGGKPVYGDRPAGKGVGDEPPPQPPVAAVPPSPPQAPTARPVAAAAPASTTAATTSSDGDLTAFIARAKGYRPLAELLIRGIRARIPATRFNVHDTHADLGAPALYGALAVTAKDIRLALDLGDRPFEGDFKRLRLPGVAATLTHTIVLSDARRVDQVLLDLVAAAAARANS